MFIFKINSTEGDHAALLAGIVESWGLLWKCVYILYVHNIFNIYIWCIQLYCVKCVILLMYKHTEKTTYESWDMFRKIVAKCWFASVVIWWQSVSTNWQQVVSISLACIALLTCGALHSHKSCLSHNTSYNAVFIVMASWSCSSWATHTFLVIRGGVGVGEYQAILTCIYHQGVCA